MNTTRSKKKTYTDTYNNSKQKNIITSNYFCPRIRKPTTE